MRRLAIGLLVLTWTSPALAQRPQIDLARLFVEGGWRVGFGPDHVPYEEPSDDDFTSDTGVFSTLETPWHLQAGGLAWVNRRLFYGSGRVDGFRPIRDGASPWILSATAGVGWTMEAWDEGGEFERTTTTHEYYDKYTGRRCEAPARPDETYAHGCEPYAVTRRETGYEPPGLVQGWAAAYAGWRQAVDLELAGALVAPGGPLVGVTGEIGKDYGSFARLVAMATLEVAYYVTGPAQELGLAGRVAAGVPWLLFDLAFRADDVTGSEFSVGLAVHLAFDP